MCFKLFLLFLCLLGPIGANGACVFDIGIYTCNDIQLQELKNPGKGRIVHLIIRNSNLTEIPANAFIDFPSLLVLDLEANQIQIVDSGAFIGLNNLNMIILSRNNISSLSLTGLQRLEHLYVNGNRISTLDVKLDNLKLFYLHDNLMTNLDFAKDLPKLEELYVKKNKLTCIDENALESSSLKKVTLSENPWASGCGNATVARLEGRNVIVMDKNNIESQSS